MGRRYLTAFSLCAASALAAVAAWVSCGGSTDQPRPSAAYPDDGGGGGSSSGATSSSGSVPGSSSGAGGSSSGMAVDMCGLPMTDAASPVIYNGALTAQSCSANLPMPRNGGWYSYNEDAAVKTTVMASPPGCAGPLSCAMHAVGSGYTVYAGVGFNFNGGSTNTPYDASAYSGIEFWAKGTVTGSRFGYAFDGGAFTQQDQTIYAEVTSSSSGRSAGDEYGAYCVLDSQDAGTWTHCRIDFATATRLGLSTPPVGVPDMFDRKNLWKMQFAFSPASGQMISFDVWIGDVYFY
jgi:hypothetical protein